MYDLGDYMFGKPSRITARTSLGNAGVINIEREADMSGRTHNKGVLILSGFLRGRYGSEQPLAMSASLCFEQSYGGVDGDSASSTELYAILSSIGEHSAQAGHRRDGLDQPEGGDPADRRREREDRGILPRVQGAGPQGSRGGHHPRAERRRSHARRRGRRGGRAKKFHIYPVRTVDEGIAILTGLPAGKPSKKGVYPKGTVNRIVRTVSRRCSDQWKDYGKEKSEK